MSRLLEDLQSGKESDQDLLELEKCLRTGANLGNIFIYWLRACPALCLPFLSFSFAPLSSSTSPTASLMKEDYVSRKGQRANTFGQLALT